MERPGAVMGTGSRGKGPPTELEHRAFTGVVRADFLRISDFWDFSILSSFRLPTYIVITFAA